MYTYTWPVHPSGDTVYSFNPSPRDTVFNQQTTTLLTLMLFFFLTCRKRRSEKKIVISEIWLDEPKKFPLQKEVQQGGALRILSATPDVRVFSFAFRFHYGLFGSKICVARWWDWPTLWIRLSCWRRSSVSVRKLERGQRWPVRFPSVGGDCSMIYVLFR